MIVPAWKDGNNTMVCVFVGGAHNLDVKACFVVLFVWFRLKTLCCVAAVLGFRVVVLGTIRGLVASFVGCVLVGGS